MFTSLFTDTLLCLNLICLKIESKIGVELGLLTKKPNIDKFFPKPSSSYSQTAARYIFNPNYGDINGMCWF